MDPVTHTLLGATVGYAATGRRLGRRAAWIGAVAAALPDVDVLIRSSTDPLLAIEYHRHFTHSLAFAVAGSLLVAGCWLRRPENRAQWRTIWLCALLAWWSHGLLDASTSYGTVLFWPFTSGRMAWNLVSIIDPLFTLLLVAGLVGARLRHDVAPVRIALAVALGYLALGGWQQSRANGAQRELAAVRGHTIERGVVMPTLGNQLVWRSLYLHEGQIHSDRIRVGWLAAATVREGTSLPRVTLDDLTPEERRQEDGSRAMERFLWFTDGWAARATQDVTVLGDMRYSLSTGAFDPIWGIRFASPGSTPPYAWVDRSRKRQVSVAELWAEIAGTDDRYRALDALRVVP
jgi:inner membrane protein